MALTGYRAIHSIGKSVTEDVLWSWKVWFSLVLHLTRSTHFDIGDAAREFIGKVLAFGLKRIPGYFRRLSFQIFFN